MQQVAVRLDKDEIHMATVLLLFVTYYPQYPPLQSFTNIHFDGRKDFVTLVEDGFFAFTDIENCTSEQLAFFQNKIQEIPEFYADISHVGTNLTRISIYPRKIQS